MVSINPFWILFFSRYPLAGGTGIALMKQVTSEILIYINC